MTARVRQSAEKTLLCATKFWSGAWQGAGHETGTSGGGVTTLRAGVRHVVRKQGFSPSEIDAAERTLVRSGLLEREGISLRITSKGRKVSCATTKLSPWTNAPYPGAALAGRRRRRR